LSCKAIHKCVEKHGRHFADDEEFQMEMQKSKYFYAVGFDALVKCWDKCIIVDGGYVKN
jgi:hypothetical protein